MSYDLKFLQNSYYFRELIILEIKQIEGNFSNYISSRKKRFLTTKQKSKGIKPHQSKIVIIIIKYCQMFLIKTFFRDQGWDKAEM